MIQNQLLRLLVVEDDGVNMILALTLLDRNSILHTPGGRLLDRVSVIIGNRGQKTGIDQPLLNELVVQLGRLRGPRQLVNPFCNFADRDGEGGKLEVLPGFLV